eukprot:1107959-Prorocentrum_minimum.AAC.2
MQGNPLCRQIDWDDNPEYLKAWEGAPPYPVEYSENILSGGAHGVSMDRRRHDPATHAGVAASLGENPRAARRYTHTIVLTPRSEGGVRVLCVSWENIQRGWGLIGGQARHACACFLTRGDLYVSWEKGRDVFGRELVDEDWALNSANWMWLSASAFFHQYFRVYGPVSHPLTRHYCTKISNKSTLLY